MKKKRRQRVLAVLMATLMIVGLIPTDFAVTAAKAATPHTFTASSTSSGLGNLALSAPVTVGTVYGDDNYFTVVGTASAKRANSTTFALELSQGATNGLEFTSTGATSVSVSCSSTGSSNNSAIGLVKSSDGSAVTEGHATPITTVYGTAASTLTYTNLPIGKYKIVSPVDTNNLRGVRVLSVTVTDLQASASADISNVNVTQLSNNANITWVESNGVGGATTLVQYSIDNKATWKTVGAGPLALNVLAATLDMTNINSGNIYFQVTGKAIVEASAPLSWTQPRAAWGSVSAPTAALSQVGSDISVAWNMLIGAAGADNLKLELLDSNNSLVGTAQNVTSGGPTGTALFTGIPASGTYTVKLTASRTDADAANPKVVASAATLAYEYPLSSPSIGSYKSNGDGSVTLNFSNVKEATSYEVYSKVLGSNDTTYVKGATVGASATTATVSGLSIGTTYTFKVVAVRTTPAAIKDSVTFDKKVDSVQEVAWGYVAFGGSGAKTSGTNNKLVGGDAYSNDLHLQSTGASKLVYGAGSDQIGFYYTKISGNMNFTLTAKIHLNSIGYDGNQDGFGLIAMDAINDDPAKDGLTFNNNSISTTASQIQYFYDSSTDTVTPGGGGNTGTTQINMDYGIGGRAKLGALAWDNAAGITTQTKTLETSCKTFATGKYNVIGNSTASPLGTQPTVYTDFTLTLQRDNSGYRCMWVAPDGKVVKQTFYDYDNKDLSVIDPASDYVGFFTSRNADITVSNVSFSTIDRASDAPAETAEITNVTPVYNVTSTTSTGIADYALTFAANADGIVSVVDPNGNTILDKVAVTAGNVVTAPIVTLKKGTNKFTVTFKPNDGYAPGPYAQLSSYDEVTLTQQVTYKTYGQTGQSIWVSPDGKATSSGNDKDPMDIYTAVKYAQPGQTIVLKEGTYNLESSVTIARGNSGTADSPITIMVDPSATSKPIFDFGKVGGGFCIAGDYWYAKGFDVTNTAPGVRGIQISGDNNTLDGVNSYNNGNAGVQLSRMYSTDSFDAWPANNLILNCTAHNNDDPTHGDADGFAAKLTCGPGNVFRGCIAYNNADDGWDLFAKPETGSIGQVTIENCVAYRNGVLEDGTDAGNGNGFKLGGNSIAGNHQLINCVSFENKAKGIDSNSGPNVIVKNCTSFNNGASNVALYTSDAKNTNFIANGIISFRTKNTSITETFKLLGTQDISLVDNATNYFWSPVTNVANVPVGSPVGTGIATGAGSAVKATTDWFVNLDTSVVPSRLADGSIDMHGLLVLTDKAPANAGGRIVSTPSKVLASVPISVPKTGDTAHTYVFFTLAMMSAAALVGLYFYDKKKKTFVKN